MHIYSVRTYTCITGHFKRYLTLTAAQSVMYHRFCGKTCFLNLEKQITKKKNIFNSYYASAHRKYFLVAIVHLFQLPKLYCDM